MPSQPSTGYRLSSIKKKKSGTQVFCKHLPMHLMLTLLSCIKRCVFQQAGSLFWRGTAGLSAGRGGVRPAVGSITSGQRCLHRTPPLIIGDERSRSSQGRQAKTVPSPGQRGLRGTWRGHMASVASCLPFQGTPPPSPKKDLGFQQAGSSSGLLLTPRGGGGGGNGLLPPHPGRRDPRISACPDPAAPHLPRVGQTPTPRHGGDAAPTDTHPREPSRGPSPSPPHPQAGRAPLRAPCPAQPTGVQTPPGRAARGPHAGHSPPHAHTQRKRDPVRGPTCWYSASCGRKSAAVSSQRRLRCGRRCSRLTHQGGE